MDSAKQLAVYCWNNIEEFYKSITPKNEKMKKLEQAVHIPAHYILMIATVVAVLIVYILAFKVFPTLIVLVPTILLFLKETNEHKSETKWMYYWIFFALITVFEGILSHIFYYGVIKVALCYYFAFFDKEGYLEKAFDYICDGVSAAIDKYEAYCAEKRD